MRPRACFQVGARAHLSTNALRGVGYARVANCVILGLRSLLCVGTRSRWSVPSRLGGVCVYALLRTRFSRATVASHPLVCSWCRASARALQPSRQLAHERQGGAGNLERGRQAKRAWRCIVLLTEASTRRLEASRLQASGRSPVFHPSAGCLNCMHFMEFTQHPMRS